MKQLLEWLEIEIERRQSQTVWDDYTNGNQAGALSALDEVRDEVAALIDSFDVDAAAQALFLAGLPRGRSGELVPGHTTWNQLGPKAKDRLRDMTKAALASIVT